MCIVHTLCVRGFHQAFQCFLNISMRIHCVYVVFTISTLSALHRSVYLRGFHLRGFHLRGFHLRGYHHISTLSTLHCSVYLRSFHLRGFHHISTLSTLHRSCSFPFSTVPLVATRTCLLQALILHAQEMGFSKVFLVTTSGQPAAIALYKKLGWYEAKVWHSQGLTFHRLELQL